MVAQNGKTALIVANSGEVAVAVSHRLAAEGFAIVAAFSEPWDPSTCIRAIRAAGGRAAAIEADPSHPEAMRALFDEAEALFAGVDVLVSDADIMQFSPLADADEATFRRHVAINNKGALSGVREAARRLRAGGRVIAISSAGGALQRPVADILSATATGVSALHRVLAAEIEARRLALNAVALCPGPFAVSDSAHIAVDPAEDLADAVARLARVEGAAVHGRVLFVKV